MQFVTKKKPPDISNEAQTLIGYQLTFYETLLILAICQKVDMKFAKK